MVKEGPAFFFTRRWWPLRGSKQHSLESNIDMVGLLGLDTSQPKMEFYCSKKDEYKIKSFLKKEKIDSFIVLHPGFGGASKQKAYSRHWSEEIYAKICDYIIKKYNLSVLITGIAQETFLAESIYNL